MALLLLMIPVPVGTFQDSPLVTWEDFLPGRAGVVLWVRNPTKDSIRVDSIHIEACINVRRGCGSRAMDLVLAPGTRKQLARLEPAVRNDRFGYRWSLDWKAIRPDTLAPLRPAPTPPPVTRQTWSRSTRAFRTT
ncbi:MAG: hypothetical protein ABI679_04725 [Gemmatimonadota bacterium]